MKQYHKGALAFLLIVMLAFQIGSYILTATFFGTISLVGLIVLIESIGPMKWIAERSTKMVDALIFIFTILATMSYGLNIAASLTIMGLGYTLMYAPWLRAHRTTKAKPRGTNYKTKFNAK